MKEFFGIGGFQRVPEGAWSWQHILFVSLMIAAALSLAIWLGKRLRDKEEKSKNKVLIWAAILIDSFELIKIIVNCSIEGIGAMRMMLPLFLCSIQLITIPLAAFTKGRIKEAALDFVMTFGILGGVFGTIGATQNYNAYPVLSMPNVVSAITHCISIFASLYIMVSGMISMKKKNIGITYGILAFFFFAAHFANYKLDYNYMFLRRGDGTPYDIFYNMVNGNQILYPLIVVGLFAIYIALFYYVYYLIVTKRAKKQPLKEANAEAPQEANAEAPEEETLSV